MASKKLFSPIDEPMMTTQDTESKVEFINLNLNPDTGFCAKRARHGECSQKYLTLQQLIDSYRNSVLKNNHQAIIQKNTTEIYKQLKRDVEQYLDHEKSNKEKAFGNNDQLARRLHKVNLINTINKKAHLALKDNTNQEELAIKLYQLGTSLGSDESYFQLAQHYFLNKDKTKLLELLNKAALSGHGLTTFDLAHNYRIGNYVTADPDKKLKFMLITKIPNKEVHTLGVSQIYERILESKIGIAITPYWLRH